MKLEFGNTLVEVTLALAITGVLSVPLSGVIASQLRVPLRVSNEVSTARQLQASTVILIDDATSSQSFSPGVDPEYGTFSWLEYAGSVPVQVTSRYYWQDSQMFRQLIREGDVQPPSLVIEGIEEYGDIVFNHTPSAWHLDEETNTWSYTRGRIAVGLEATRESTSEFIELLRRGLLVADFRPKQARPSVFPQPP